MRGRAGHRAGGCSAAWVGGVAGGDRDSAHVTRTPGPTTARVTTSIKLRGLGLGWWICGLPGRKMRSRPPARRGPHRRQGRGRGGTLGRPEPRSREGLCVAPAVSHQVQSRPRRVTPQRPSPPCVTPKLPGLQEVALSRKRSLQTAPAESRPESVAAVLVRRECGRRRTHGGHPVETEAETRRPGCLDPTPPPGLPGHSPHGRHDLDSALQPWAPPRSSGSGSGSAPGASPRETVGEHMRRVAQRNAARPREGATPPVLAAWGSRHPQDSARGLSDRRPPRAAGS